jgi:hypothetical protein
VKGASLQWQVRQRWRSPDPMVQCKPPLKEWRNTQDVQGFYFSADESSCNHQGSDCIPLNTTLYIVTRMHGRYLEQIDPDSSNRGSMANSSLSRSTTSRREVHSPWGLQDGRSSLVEPCLRRKLEWCLCISALRRCPCMNLQYEPVSSCGCLFTSVFLVYGMASLGTSHIDIETSAG